MNKRHVLWQMISVILIVGMLVFPVSRVGAAGEIEKPDPATPFEAEESGVTLFSGGPALAPASGGNQATFLAGGNRLVATQNADGGWGWPLTGASAPNTIGPIAMGLAYAYQNTGDSAQRAALVKAGDFLLAKSHNFSPSDGSLAAKLDQVFGGTVYTDYVIANFYDPLAAGTYTRAGDATLYTTASYIERIRTARSGDQANLATWDIGIGLVGAAMAGASTAEWIAATKAEINELDGDNYYDVIGLAGGLYGLAYVGEDFDPTAGEHAAASSISDLADILASYQINNGGFAWNMGYVIPDDGNEAVQETAYAIQALSLVDRAAYLSKIQGASQYLVSVQLATGGWEDYPTSGENNEITGEALMGIYIGIPEVWVKHPGAPLVTGSMAFDPSVIKDGATYKMWYTHVDNAGVWTIYYADSTDGITWSNNTQVLAASGTADAYDEVRVAAPSVINDGGTYKMWFMGRDASAVWAIGYATSPDGLNWTNAGQVLDVGGAGAWDSQMVRDPAVILDGGTYKMWYAGTASWPAFKIGYATSPDGITWTKDLSNPVFTGTTDGWDGFQVYAPSVVKDGGIYQMYFSGTDNNMSQVWSTGHASSSDGITWTEAVRNPILIPDGTDDSLDYVSAMNDDGTWKIWYSYGGSYAIGLATQTTDTQLWLDPAVASISNDNVTTQTFTVRIANAVDLYGYQFVITFDPANLEATAAAFDNSFINGVSYGWDAEIDNTNGEVRYTRFLLNPALPVAGDGPLATVTFRSKVGATAGRYKIDFDQNILSNRDGMPLSHITQYAWLTLYGLGNLAGSVDLQGRTVESGGTVSILNAAGYLASTTIDDAGLWSFTNIPAGSYQVNIEMARYLDAQKGADAGGVTVPSGGTNTLTLVKLLGGDANDDDLVDVSDASIIGGMFGLSGAGLTDVRADINNDGIVNILDLALMGGNYNKVSPVPWP